MPVPQCVTAPGDEPLHGAQRWHVVVVTVTITVVVLVCAGVSPEWLSGIAALVSVLTSAFGTASARSDRRHHGQA